MQVMWYYHQSLQVKLYQKKKKKNLLKVTKPSDKEYLIHLAILSTWKNLTSAVQNQNSMPKG